jgi:hypothetical protein
VQRQRASGCARMIDVPTCHHPFLAQPDTFAELLVNEIR